MTRTVLALSLLLACPALALAQPHASQPAPASHSYTGFRYSVGIDGGLAAIDYNDPSVIGASSWAIGLNAFLGEGIGTVRFAAGPTSMSFGYRLQLNGVADGIFQMHELAFGARRGNLVAILGAGVAVGHPYASPLDMVVGAVVDSQIGYTLGDTGMFIDADIGVAIFANDVDRVGVTIGYTNF